MYKSPIDVSFTQYINDVVTAEENAVVSAVVKCGIDVDKDELVKALRYDRDQYIQGYTDAEPKWIPCSERLPENMELVNVTWINRDPEPYYMNIKDKPFTATGIYFRGKWYWYSVTCKDMLGEYGENEIDEVADGIEIVAWMPLPKPYQEVEHD